MHAQHYYSNKIERKLIDSEKKLSLITENSLDGFLIIENKKVSYASPSFYKILGYNNEEMLRFDVEAIYNNMHPDDMVRVRNFINENLKNQEKTFKCEFRTKIKIARTSK